MLLGAFGLIGYNLYDSWRADKASEVIMEHIIEVKETEEDLNVEALNDLDVPIYELFPQMDMPAVEIDGYRYIATLEIPELNLVLPVMEDWDYSRLKISPCRYAGSVYTHDMVIAGHNYASHFSKIKWLKNGTKVKLTDMYENEFNYTIAWTEVIDPEDVDSRTENFSRDDNGEIKEGSNWDLTLFTCTTGGSARFAARCVLDAEE